MFHFAASGARVIFVYLYLVTHDSGYVSLERLLPSWYPSQEPTNPESINGSIEGILHALQILVNQHGIFHENLGTITGVPHLQENARP
jgi:hypothetical protein